MKSSSSRGFTLLELLVVIAIILIVAAFLIPALSPNSSRALDGASHQFAADLENARLIAIAERTQTRVLLPSSATNFANPVPSVTPWPSDIALRGYVITSEKKLKSVWKQRGKWNRFPDGVAVKSFGQDTPTPTPGAIPIDVGGSGNRISNYHEAICSVLSQWQLHLRSDCESGPGRKRGRWVCRDRADGDIQT